MQFTAVCYGLYGILLDLNKPNASFQLDLLATSVCFQCALFINTQLQIISHLRTPREYGIFKVVAWIRTVERNMLPCPDRDVCFSQLSCKIWQFSFFKTVKQAWYFPITNHCTTCKSDWRVQFTTSFCKVEQRNMREVGTKYWLFAEKNSWVPQF